MRRPARVVAAFAVVALVATVAGCSDSVKAPTPLSTTYAALGDSYTAGPYIPENKYAKGCLRSDSNYPHLLAERLGKKLTDVSCSGATTDSILGPQTPPGSDETVDPQLDALTVGTGLVTLSVGGNDGGFYGAVVGNCLVGGDARCKAALGSVQDLDQAAAGFTERLSDVISEIHKRAPAAEVLLVGYPRLVSVEDGCPAVALRKPQRKRVVEVEELMNEAFAQAAEDTDAEFVDLRPLSKGHELCSPDPWINGPVTDKERALAYHPFAVEQEAVAEHLVKLVLR